MQNRTSDSFPLSPLQLGIWANYKLNPDSVAYNIPLAIDISGKLSIERLADCLRQLTDRHDVFHLRFTDESGDPKQTAVRSRETPLDVRVVSESKIDEIVTDFMSRAFDLSTDPPFSVTLFDLGNDRMVLAMVFHHIAFDGVSIRLLLRELTDLYNGGRDVSAPSTDGAGRDAFLLHCSKERDAAASAKRRESVNYWVKDLTGAPPCLELMTDKSRRPNVSEESGFVKRSLPAGFSKVLRDYSRGHGMGMSVPGLAALVAVLGRYTEHYDLVVGMPVARRIDPAIARALGYLVNLVAIRTQFSPETTFTGLCMHVREKLLFGLQHSEVPFSSVVARVRPQRSPLFAPLLQSTYSYQENDVGRFRLGSADAVVREVSTFAAKFDISLAVKVNDDASNVSLVYRADLFDQISMERLIDNYITLLMSGLSEPTRSVADLELINEKQALEVIEAGGGVGGNAEAPSTTVDALVAAQAERTPARTAVQDGEHCWTYAELMCRATQFANHLQANGVRRNMRVAVCMSRSADLVAALLGVFMCGAAYVPLDPDYPRNYRSVILEDAKVDFIITQPDLAQEFTEDHTLIIPPRVPPGPGLDEAPMVKLETEESRRDPESLAVIIYTSGSTGRPKGVSVSHKNIATLLDWASSTYGPEELAHVLFGTSICFDISMFELWAPLVNGGGVVVVSSVLALGDDRERPRAPISLINTVPSALDALLRIGAIPETVKTINVAGEALPLRLVNQALGETTALHIRNLYGPTEDTVYSTVACFERPLEDVPPIGTPLPRKFARVLDKAGRLVPMGAIGELYLGGAGLSSGYWRQPDLTADRFVTRFVAGREELLYRTGDLATWRSDGQLRYLGRLDQQIKLRGFRIELHDVESTLLRHPAVQAVAVAPSGSGSGELSRSLVAHIVLDTDHAGSAEQIDAALREHVAKNLPEYMNPTSYSFLEALPMTPSGKVDRTALSRIPIPIQPARVLVRAETDLEKRLSSLWSEALGVEEVGVSDNFFELGGNSLSALTLIAKINSEFATSISMRDFLVIGNIRSLAARIAEGPGNAAEELELVSGEVEDTVALSVPQRGFWHMQHRLGAPNSLNLSLAVRLSGRLNVEQLRSSLVAIALRHEPLRSRFHVAGGEPVMTVDDRPNVDLRLAHANTEGGDDVEQLIGEEARLGFDLETEHPWRALLIQTGDTDAILVLTFHHLAMDGWSLNIFKRELTDLYRGTVISQMPDLPVNYRQFAVANRLWHQSERFRRQMAHFGQRLLSVGTDPTYSEQATGDPHELRVLPLEFARGLGTSLDRTSATRRTTTLVLLMTALETAVFDTFPTQKAVINTATFGRLKPELMSLIGVFANVVTVVSERRKVKAASAHVRDVHDRLYDAERNSEPDMVASLMSAGAPRPKVPILFLNYQAYPNTAGWELEGLACEKVDIPIGSRPPVSLAQVAITREGDSLRGSLGYDAGRLSLEVATRLRDGMVRALNELPFGVDALS
jgi:amino acid adenylation domain-containing protein